MDVVIVLALTIFCKIFSQKYARGLGNFCTFAVAKSFPKWETFCGNKNKKLSKTENFYQDLRDNN
jgi:hypothetical protein